jgi:hypothetical protein
VWMALDTFLINASIYNMLAISLDRYLAIARPLHYRSFARRYFNRGRGIYFIFNFILLFYLYPLIILK